MDLIHLLEILNPVGKVLTVKIDNAKSTFDTFSELLVTASPIVVALIAMWLSHRQFKKNLSQQTLQFQIGIRRQLDELRLNTQLATKIELQKETCKDVRTACVNFLEYANAYYTNKHLYSGYQKVPSNERNENHENLIDEAFKLSVEYSQKVSSSRFFLITFLDPKRDELFIRKIDKVMDVANMDFSQSATEELGEAKRQCLDMCREFISTIHQEIIRLSENLKADE